jgi:outer membrane immunogenic protein
MKKILLSSVALVGFTAGAMAADLPSRAAPVPMIAAVPLFTWTGFYVGVNAGYGFSTNDDDDVFVPGVGFVGSGNDDGGFVGGAQVGYNYQIGQVVLGLEADIQYADIGGGNDNFFVDGGLLGNNDDSDNYFGTVRARLGFAIDRALLFVTGGFAYGDVGGGRFGGGSEGGWTLGGGVEYAITNNITVKLEGLYVNLDSGGDDDFLFDTGVFNNRDDQEFGVVRAGLNFKF